VVKVHYVEHAPLGRGSGQVLVVETAAHSGPILSASARASIDQAHRLHPEPSGSYKGEAVRCDNTRAQAVLSAAFDSSAACDANSVRHQDTAVKPAARLLCRASFATALEMLLWDTMESHNCTKLDMAMMMIGRRLIAAVIHLSVGSPSALSAEMLQSYAADISRTTVSGFSSGGFMAMQFHVANSSWVKGAGIIAGGPYNCGRYYSALGLLALSWCTGHSTVGATDVDLLFQSTIELAKDGKIDPVEDLRDSKIYLFSGTLDFVVTSTAVGWARDFYKQSGIPAGQVVFEKSIPAGHAFLTVDYGSPCSSSSTPYVDQGCFLKNRPYDQALAVLSHLYGDLSGPARPLSSSPKAFDQHEFGGKYLADSGYVYVPIDCKQAVPGACRVHVVFHGCGQAAANWDVGDAVYGHAGYNRWADQNKIIVLYPQTTPSAVNFDGCWDWWGYTNYLDGAN
jgi:hypothetical protein